MKLLYSPNSPYARVARVCALQLGVELEFVEVAIRQQADAILEYNPAAIVPTLVLDDGSFLAETRLICEFLETRGTGAFIASTSDFENRHWEGFCTVFLDGVAVWIREIRRPAGEQSPGVIELERNRAERCLKYYEDAWQTSSEHLSYACATLVSALELVETRLPLAWQQQNPRLADWYRRMSRHEFLRLTAPLPL